MIFRKSKTQEETFPFPGEEKILNGHGAAYAVEAMASEAVLVRAVPDLAEISRPARYLVSDGGDSIHDQPPTTREIAHLRPLLGQLAGYAQVGVRTAGLTNDLGATHEALCAAAGRRLTYVINLTCRALQRQAGALHGGHDDFYRVADTGCFQFFAKNAQETADLTLIAHRIAELALTPGICAQDFYQTTHALEPLRCPEKELIDRYLGKPGDMIPAPTPAQELLYGKTRRRIPLLLDRDRPAGIGGIQDHESYYRAVAAQRPFFSNHLDGIIDLAMGEFAELTGRTYRKADGYRTEDAEVVVIAQGAILETLEQVVDYLREKEKVKAGVIALRMFRPFPGPEITRLLKGKKAVTVLERTDQPLAAELPMTREIRSAISRAVENGVPASPDAEPPFAAYERYTRASDSPRVHSGVYGVGGELPSFGDLAAVFRNMLAKGKGRRLFYVGDFFAPADRRFPHLQSLQQWLSKQYPALGDLTVGGSKEFEPPVQPGFAVELYSLSAQGGIFAGNLFAGSLADSLGWAVRTFPEGGLEPNIQPVGFTILHGETGRDRKDGAAQLRSPERVDMVLVSGERLVEDLPSRSRIKTGGTLVIASNRAPRDLWLSLSNRTARWVEQRGIRVMMIDSQTIASETASRSSFVDQLAIWTLFGAYLKTGEHVSDKDLDAFLSGFRERLAVLLGPSNYLIGDIITCVKAGADQTAEINWKAFAEDRKLTVTEPEPPWTVQAVDQHDRTVFDVNRFWHSVGYLYNTGEPAETLTDPYLATGIMPAGSSAFRDMAPYRLRIPRWLPSNCEACGLCWSVCPDSALPPSVNSLPAILKTAMTTAEKNGVPMVQMQRAADHLAKQAYKLVQQDDTARYTTLGPLFRDAFSQLTKKMGLDGDKLKPMQTEFDEIHRLVEHHPFSKTDEFFNNPHAETKGTGTLLSIAQNPLSCTACGLCVEVCPNDAYEWVDQTQELLDKEKKVWQFQMTLPSPDPTEIEPHITASEPRTNVYRMLDKTAYHSLVGGDAAFPGNSVKTAVHLVTSTIETFMRPQYESHIEKIGQLIDQIEQRIQGTVSRAVEINDFENFGQRLGRLRKEGLTADSLAKMLDDGRGGRDVDRLQLERLTDLHKRLKDKRRLYLEGASGTGRARMAVTIDPGGATFWSGTYPYNPHQHPWISHLPGDGPALAEGVFEGLTRSLVEEFKLCRRAELEISDSYDPLEHDEFFKRFGAGDLSADEWKLVPPVLVISQSGTTSTREIGRLLRSRYPIRMVIINTQGVPVPAASSAPASSDHDGDLSSAANQSANSLGYLLLAQRDAFVLQSTVGHPGHLIEGVFEGMAQRRPAVFHIYAPDPHTNGIAPERVAEQAVMGFESRAFPLFKMNPENETALITLEANPEADHNWPLHAIEVKEPSGIESSLEVPLTVAHWAFREARFQKHFRVVPKGELNDSMKPLAEFLTLDTSEREGIEPYIDITDENDHHFLAIVSPAMTRTVEDQLVFWNYLRKLAAALEGRPAPEAAQEAPASEPPEPQETPPPVIPPSMEKGVTESLLQLAGYGRDPGFFNQTLGQFISREKSTGTTEETTDD